MGTVRSSHLMLKLTQKLRHQSVKVRPKAAVARAASPAHTPMRACPVRASQSDRVRGLSPQSRASMLRGRQEVINIKLQPQAELAALRVSPAAVPRPHALACAGGELGHEQSWPRVDRKGALRCWPRSQALHAPRV